ncbi:class I SAM-dependent methyltransferase [Oerskovia sp. NPDC056781]|uniref:class I SAM-dependent methyltransferase n=1 Tax=Oerskovia sp. NPDC056781 TaxID=3345942 RepID=UPI00366C431B
MSDPYWNHSTHYYPVLARLVGPGTRTALDVGCGEGLLTRRLRAAGAVEVLGLDLDPEQVDRARRAAGGSPSGLDYLAGDVLEPLPGSPSPSTSSRPSRPCITCRSTRDCGACATWSPRAGRWPSWD